MTYSVKLLNKGIELATFNVSCFSVFFTAVLFQRKPLDQRPHQNTQSLLATILHSPSSTVQSTDCIPLLSINPRIIDRGLERDGNPMVVPSHGLENQLGLSEKDWISFFTSITMDL
jgi:hypothetical protein